MRRLVRHCARRLPVPYRGEGGRRRTLVVSGGHGFWPLWPVALELAWRPLVLRGDATYTSPNDVIQQPRTDTKTARIR